MSMNFMRQPVASTVAASSKPYQFPAPVRGLVRNDNISQPIPGGADILDNFFPTQFGLRPRAGSPKKATVSLSGAVQSLFNYVTANTKKLFASTGTDVYDVTTVADPNIPPAADITGLTAGYFSYEQFATAGGEFLYIVNGFDDPYLYNGTTWQQMNALSVPALINGSSLSHVWAFKKRLFFIKRGTMSAYYLPVDSIAGTLVEFPLRGIFKKGGSLLTGATWSIDAGDGIDDKCVFITTEGEVAVYQGTDPSSATDWSLVGRYEISRPMGKRALMRIGGDLYIATIDGLIPLNEAISKSVEDLSLSRNIDPYWRADTAIRSQLPWEVVRWDEKNMAIVSSPINSSDQDKYCYVVNLTTNAWCRYTGWDTRCTVVHDGQFYFGTNDGKVFLGESGGLDDGQPYSCTCLWAFDQMGSLARNKHVILARSIILSNLPFSYKLFFCKNYETKIPSAPSALPINGLSSQWDSAQWDVSVWDGDNKTKRRYDDTWKSIGKYGYSMAPGIIITSGNSVALDLEVVSIDSTYEVGAFVA